MKDTWKRASAKDYTKFDLNCKCILDNHGNRRSYQKMVNRKTRRKMKENLKKGLTD